MENFLYRRRFGNDAIPAKKEKPYNKIFIHFLNLFTTMKKLLSFICFLIILFGIMANAAAHEIPKVIVHKSNGGSSAIINCYNTVNYDPCEGNTDIIGRLECYGQGFTLCRVPRGSTLISALPGTNQTPNDKINNDIIDIVNELIEVSANPETQNMDCGQKSKTIAVNIPNTRKYFTFKINAQWNYDAKGNGDIIISIIPGTLDMQKL